MAALVNLSPAWTFLTYCEAFRLPILGLLDTLVGFFLGCNRHFLEVVIEDDCVSTITLLRDQSGNFSEGTRNEKGEQRE